MIVSSSYIYSEDSIMIKVENLLSKMTLDEKIGQMVQVSSQWEMTGPVPKDKIDIYNNIKSGRIGSMLNVTGVKAIRKAQELAVNHSRLGIPLIFGYDVIHGYKTIFPIPLGETASWEPELARKTAEIAAIETASSGINWTFAPMMDINRDARWGRGMEGSGEDTYLNTVFAVSRVKGFQGDDLSAEYTIAACAKHFAGYGFSESGKDYNTTEITNNTLHNYVLPPFKACVEAGVATVMNSFNEIGGVPCTANDYLQRNILKGEWGFKGFVVSDWNSIGELITQGCASNKKQASETAILAGSDMDMEGYCYLNNLKDLVKEGSISESSINESVKRILYIKYKLGLFDDPFKYCNEEREGKRVYSPEYRQLAREVAKRSIVLVKNDNKLLPLPIKGKKIAVIGEMAKDKDNPLGSWRASAIPNSAISLLEGLKNAKSKNVIYYAKGPSFLKRAPSFNKPVIINNNDTTGIHEAVNIAKKCDLVILNVGENCFQSGESRSYSDIRIKGLQEFLVKKIYNANPNIVLIISNGRALDLTNIEKYAKSILITWHLGSESGNAISDVLFGYYNPSGKLPVSFPRSVGQLPIYYNYKNTGRPSYDKNSLFVSNYQDIENTPLYPFGYGLSYTKFKLSDLKIENKCTNDSIKYIINVNLSNVGNCYGEEVVQLYIRDVVSSTVRPIKELKDFKKVGLHPNEEKLVSFEIDRNDLEFYTKNKKWEIEPGEFTIWVSDSSIGGLKGSILHH